MNVLVSAGELSGDLYAAHMVRALRARWGDEVRFWGMGGPQMAAAGVEPVISLKSMQIHGVIEVLPHIRRLFRAFRTLIRTAEQRRPSFALLVDFQDFHLRLARELHRRGVRVIQMVAPTVWAWRPDRTRTVRDAVDRLLVIFPFEESLWREAGVDAHYIGYPLMDIIRVQMTREALVHRLQVSPDTRIIGLLPGSRPAEVRRHLPVLLQAIRRLERDWPLYPYIVQAPTVSDTLIDAILRRHGRERMDRIRDHTKYDWMANSDLLLVASGTAVMEAALVRAPAVVLYRMHPINWWIARRLVRVPYASMVNLLAGQPIVPELLQSDCTPERIARVAHTLLQNAGLRKKMILGYLEVIDRLGCLHAFSEGPRVIEEALQQWQIPVPTASYA